MNRDPFRGYDQWKTASPYDNDCDVVLEGLIPRFPVECPCCRYNGNSDGQPIMAEWYEHETPGDDEFDPEIECGWHCEECDWQQECLPEDWRNDATVPYAQQLANLSRRRFDLRKQANQRKPDVSSLDDFNLPPGDFEWTGEEAGDWHVWCCGEKDCPRQWHKTAYAWDFKRENGELEIACNSVDEDGNWDFDTAWVDDGTEQWEESWTAHKMATESFEYFYGWAEYWLDCANSMTDILEEANHGPHTMKPADWIKFCIDAVTDNLNSLEKCIERMVNK